MNSVSIWSCPSAESLKRDFAEAADDSLGVILVPERFTLWPFLESVRSYLDMHVGSVHLFSIDNTRSLKHGLVAAIFEENSPEDAPGNGDSLREWGAASGGNLAAEALETERLECQDPEGASPVPDVTMEELTGMFRYSKLIAYVAEPLTQANFSLLLAQLRELGDAVKRAKDNRRPLEWHLLVIVPGECSIYGLRPYPRGWPSLF